MWYLQMTVRVDNVKFKNHMTYTYQIFQSTKSISRSTRFRVTKNFSFGENRVDKEYPQQPEKEWILESEQILNAQHPAFCEPELYPIGWHLLEMCRNVQHKQDQHALKAAGY